MRTRWRVLGACGLLALSLGSCTGSPSSLFTSLRAGDCAAPPADVRARFAAATLGVQQCDGVEAWEVLLVSSDTSSWLELQSPETVWSSEAAIVYDDPIGQFPAVDDEVALEWRLGWRRGPTALLFTVTALDPEDAESRVSRVFVARFEGYARVCLIGRETSIEAARALADGPTSCPTPEAARAPVSDVS